MINVEHIEAQLAGHALVRSVDRPRSGPVRIETAFLYPDGASIDLFVVEAYDPFPTIELSDLGQTMAWLLDVQVKPWLSRKRQAFIDDALRLYGVHQRGAQLVRPLDGRLDEPIAAIVLLGQACVRVADLVFTKRSTQRATHQGSR